MKTYWLVDDRKKEEYFIKYAASFDRTLIPKDAVIAYIVEQDEICGFSVLSYDGGAAYILFFIVFKEYRRRGFASFMLNDVIKRLQAAGIDMIYGTLPSDMDICGFFESSGFELFPGNEEYVTTFGELKYCEKYRMDITGRAAKGPVSLKDCTNEQLKKVRRVMEASGILEPRGYDMELSTAVFHKGEVDSILLCERVAGGIIIRLMLFTSGGRPVDLAQCLRALDEKLSAEEGSASLKLSFPADPEANLKIIGFLTGHDVIIERINRGFVAVKRL